MVEDHYASLATMLKPLRPAGRPWLLGISGAQGTGKTTLANYLSEKLRQDFGWSVANLSIDDFYFTRAERAKLATKVHPLLATRGVPGTHNTRLLIGSLKRLQTLGPGEMLPVPQFDKAMDDRVAESDWLQITGPLDLIILEGWCVAARARPEEEMATPINALERAEDSDGSWRRYVNHQLRSNYAEVFAMLDWLVFLSAPGFAAIRKWRWQQEQELAGQSDVAATEIMSKSELNRFIQHFERITRDMLAELPTVADFVYYLDESHDVAGVSKRSDK